MKATTTRVFAGATLADLAAMRRFLQETADAWGIDEDSAGDMILAVNEAASNSLRHGYGGRPGDIELQADRADGALTVTLRDSAPLFDPTRQPAPDTTLGLERRRLGGMGVHIMRKFTDELRYRVTPTGQNELVFIKTLAV